METAKTNLQSCLLVFQHHAVQASKYGCISKCPTIKLLSYFCFQSKFAFIIKTAVDILSVDVSLVHGYMSGKVSKFSNVVF